MAQTEPESGVSNAQSLPEVCILLAVYNGATHLNEQLQSFAAQNHTEWSLIASDDGSSDDSLTQIADFAAQHPERNIRCRPGPKKGFVRNFLSLLQAVPSTTAFAALSDQDDIWFPDKLKRAIAALSSVPESSPAIYCAATLICQDDLTPLGPSTSFRKPPDFRNALVQSIGGGHTMVLNRAAIDLAADAAARIPDPAVHDWWLYQLITASGGIIVRDPEPVLYYRQHGGNLIGANTSTRARLIRIIALLNGRFCKWNESNLAAFDPLEAGFTRDAQHVLAHYRAARHGPVWRRLHHLKASGAYRQGRAGTVALYLACILGRL